MSTKYTAGHWQQHDNHPMYGPDYAATVWGPEGPGHGMLADFRQWPAVEERIANAKLAAAAPLLYAAAEAGLRYDAAIQSRASEGKSWVEGDDLDALQEDWITKTRAALAAAQPTEGQE